MRDTQGAISTGYNISGERSRCEHTCWYPKDGELYLNKMKPGDTTVEAHSNPDVQNQSSNLVTGAKF